MAAAALVREEASMLVRTLAVALVAAQPTAHAAPMSLHRSSPFYRTAKFVPPSPATYAAPGMDGRIARAPSVRRVAPVLAAGRLPNQQVGPMRERFVRDICIGC